LERLFFCMQRLSHVLGEVIGVERSGAGTRSLFPQSVQQHNVRCTPQPPNPNITAQDPPQWNNANTPAKNATQPHSKPVKSEQPDLASADSSTSKTRSTRPSPAISADSPSYTDSTAQASATSSICSSGNPPKKGQPSQVSFSTNSAQLEALTSKLSRG